MFSYRLPDFFYFFFLFHPLKSDDAIILDYIQSRQKRQASIATLRFEVKVKVRLVATIFIAKISLQFDKCEWKLHTLMMIKIQSLNEVKLLHISIRKTLKIKSLESTLEINTTYSLKWFYSLMGVIVILILKFQFYTPEKIQSYWG